MQIETQLTPRLYLVTFVDTYVLTLHSITSSEVRLPL